MKLLAHSFTENVFDNTYHVIVGNEEDAEKWITKKLPGYGPSIDNSYACALHIDTSKKRATVIYFSSEAWKDKKYIHDTIAHEALHATIRSLDIHSIKFDVNNHELYCYTLGWIVREIYKLRK